MTTTRPTIILSLGRPALLPVGAIAIDLKNNCFWRGVMRRPKWSQYGPPSIYGPAPFRIVALLMIRSPNFVTMQEIIDYLWADDPNGGPDDAKNYVHKRIDIARNGRKGESGEPILTWLGARIIPNYTRGMVLEFIERPTNHIAEQQV